MMHAARKAPIPVIPAQAGIHAASPHGTVGAGFPGRRRSRAFTPSRRNADSAWIPAFAGMTKKTAGITKERAGVTEETTGMTKGAEMVTFAGEKGSDNEGCRR